MADEIIGHMREKIVIGDDIDIVPRKRPEKSDDYLPFENIENGPAPMPSFGDGFNIHVTGLTHDERGYPDTNDPDTHGKLIKRICDKVLNNRDKICSVQSSNCEDADIVIVGCTKEQEAMLSSYENVTCIGYVNDRQEMADIYASCDVFVNLTHADTLPTVNMESICCGTPVITYNCCGSPELVDSDSGYVVEENDIESLLLKIKQIKVFY